MKEKSDITKYEPHFIVLLVSVSRKLFCHIALKVSKHFLSILYFI